MTRTNYLRVENGRAVILVGCGMDDCPYDGYHLPPHAVWREVLIWINSDHHTLPPWTRPKG